MAAAAGRAMVIAGCSDTSLTTVIDLGVQASRSGADAIMVRLPYYFRLTAREVHGFFSAINDAIDLPFILYNNPSVGPSGDIPIDTIADISQLTIFVGLKEASPDVVRFWELIDRFGDRFPVIAASESPLFFMLAAGSPGCLTATAAFAPELLRDLINAFRRSDLPAARDLFRRLYAFR